jgi:hypothetical protein
MSEAQEHEMICQYIRAKYPDVIFLSDASGLKMTIGQAVKWSRLKSHRGIPDIIILAPRKGYHGLMIELKKTGTKIKKKNGEWKDDHIQEQAYVLGKLERDGYLSGFCIGYEDAIQTIDNYL